MPSFSHIFMLYPLSCKDILETTTLTLPTSTPQQNNRRPFFLRHAPWSARCAKRLLGCLQVPQVSLIRHGNPRRSHRPLPWPEGQNDHQGSMMSPHGQLQKHPGWNISENIGVMEKRTFFFCKSCKVATSQNPISSRMMERFLQPVFNQLGEMKLMSNLLHLSSFKVSFLSSNRTKQLPFVGRKKTEGYLLLTSTFQKQMKNNRTKKQKQKTLPLPYDIFHFPIFSPTCREIPEFWVPRQPMICPAYSSCWSQRWCRRYLVAAWELWRNNE